MDSQLSERLEVLGSENKRLRDENERLMATNKHLARQLIERNELVVTLELEARKAKKGRRR